MTDRALLELAAKAAGIEGVYNHGFKGEFCGITIFANTEKTWNPLTDDGDALRLAVKLGLVVDSRYSDPMTAKLNRVYYWPKGKERETWKHIDHDVDTDPYAATRRAIVRAAAEIGKDMK